MEDLPRAGSIVSTDRLDRPDIKRVLAVLPLGSIEIEETLARELRVCQLS